MFPYKAIDLGSRIQPLPADGSVPYMQGWHSIHTPGHTEGHVALFRNIDRCLIAGDAFVTTKQESLWAVLLQKLGVNGPPAYFTPHWGKAKSSVEKLLSLRPALAVTGHGKPMRGQRLITELESLIKNFNDITVPKHGRYRHTRLEDGKSKSIEAEEAEWLHLKLDRSGKDSPDLAMAPMGTDQEAGGAITTLSGRRKYSEGNKQKYVHNSDSRNLH